MGVYLAIADTEVELADRVLETTQTSGTGAYALDGVSAQGRQSFVSGVGSGNATVYVAELESSWEIGVGTVTAGAPDTLSRDFIIATSAGAGPGGAALNWPTTAVKSIFIDTTASLLLNIGSGLSVWCGSATGTNILAVGSTYPITNYFDGLTIRFRKNSNANTASVNINFNNIGEVDLLKRVGVEIPPGELPGFAFVEAVYNADIGAFVCTAGIKPTGARLGATRIYTSDDEWPNPSGLAFIELEEMGGGGSGAGAGAASHSGGGGGGGEYAFARIPASALGSTETVTIGTGGASPSAGNNPGNAGGTTSFGSLLTAAGGGAAGALASSASLGGAGGTGGTTGSIGSGFSYHIAGSPGETGCSLDIGGETRVSALASGGRGGGPLGGGGGRAQNTAITGNPGALYGGGGGGTARGTAAGGAGAAGVVIVREYFE